MNDLKRLFGYMGPYRRDMALGMLLVVVESAFEMVIPILMSDIIDQGVAHGDVRAGPDHRAAVRPVRRPGLLWLRRTHPPGRIRQGAGLRLRQPGPL